MLMKIGDVTSQFGISHRALHYWESAGILQSSRAGNDYRYYDEENLQKIRQIVLLRKLRLSIPSIQEIFQSQDLSKVVAVFTAHLDETKKERRQLDALGRVLRQLINMLRDRQDIGSVYKYLSANHSAESEELRAALQTVLSGPVQESAKEIPEPIVDITGIDLSLEPMMAADIPEVTQVIKRRYANVKPEDMDKLLHAWDFNGLHMPDCRWFYKIMRGGVCVGAVNLAYVGMEAILIRCLAYDDPDGNAYLFELLKRQCPGFLCWNIYFPHEDGDMEHYCYDWEGKKRRFAEDNGFIFYTNSRRSHYIKMLKPHDEVYNSSRYRFALLDGSMDGVSFRFFGANNLDWFDGKMTGWRVTDCDFADALIYDSYMGRGRIYDSTLDDCQFRYSGLRGCEFTQCDFTGATIDGIPVKEALALYRKENG